MEYIIDQIVSIKHCAHAGVDFPTWASIEPIRNTKRESISANHGKHTDRYAATCAGIVERTCPIDRAWSIELKFFVIVCVFVLNFPQNIAFCTISFFCFYWWLDSNDRKKLLGGRVDNNPLSQKGLKKYYLNHNVSYKNMILSLTKIYHMFH